MLYKYVINEGELIMCTENPCIAGLQADYQPIMAGVDRKFGD